MMVGSKLLTVGHNPTADRLPPSRSFNVASVAPSSRAQALVGGVECDGRADNLKS